MHTSPGGTFDSVGSAQGKHGLSGELADFTETRSSPRFGSKSRGTLAQRTDMICSVKSANALLNPCQCPCFAAPEAGSAPTSVTLRICAFGLTSGASALGQMRASRKGQYSAMTRRGDVVATLSLPNHPISRQRINPRVVNPNRLQNRTCV